MSNVVAIESVKSSTIAMPETFPLPLLRAIVRSFACASDDPTRVTILGVDLRATGDSVVLCATDGHCLMRTSYLSADLARWIGDKRYLVSPDALPVLKMLAKEKYREATIKESDKGGLVLSLDGLSVTLGLQGRSGFEFPDYTQVIPSPDDTWLKVSFNPELLAQLNKAIEEKGSKANKGMTLRFKPKLGDDGELIGLDALAPIHITRGSADSFEYVGALMPMRL